MYRMQVISSCKLKADPSLFELPANVKILKNVPYTDIYKLGIQR
jgi:hypothetical protein